MSTPKTSSGLTPPPPPPQHGGASGTTSGTAPPPPPPPPTSSTSSSIPTLPPPPGPVSPPPPLPPDPISMFSQTLKDFWGTTPTPEYMMHTSPSKFDESIKSIRALARTKQWKQCLAMADNMLRRDSIKTSAMNEKLIAVQIRCLVAMMDLDRAHAISAPHTDAMNEFIAASLRGDFHDVEPSSRVKWVETPLWVLWLAHVNVLTAQRKLQDVLTFCVHLLRYCDDQSDFLESIDEAKFCALRSGEGSDKSVSGKGDEGERDRRDSCDDRSHASNEGTRIAEGKGTGVHDEVKETDQVVGEGSYVFPPKSFVEWKVQWKVRKARVEGRIIGILMEHGDFFGAEKILSPHCSESIECQAALFRLRLSFGLSLRALESLDEFEDRHRVIRSKGGDKVTRNPEETSEESDEDTMSDSLCTIQRGLYEYSRGHYDKALHTFNANSGSLEADVNAAVTLLYSGNLIASMERMESAVKRRLTEKKYIPTSILRSVFALYDMVYSKPVAEKCKRVLQLTADHAYSLFD
eukprot:TRINITY_DN548_c0_g1_i1.p1 TRINITY_DN548_c0_g1~~TRINITY_DN548_c0_g1_i1.p1  ORF type:complete len:521 (+),score=137.84 TRINITY_DN548_c0_g1_i1:114-1676(+)